MIADILPDPNTQFPYAQPNNLRYSLAASLLLDDNLLSNGAFPHAYESVIPKLEEFVPAQYLNQGMIVKEPGEHCSCRRAFKFYDDLLTLRDRYFYHSMHHIDTFHQQDNEPSADKKPLADLIRFRHFYTHFITPFIDKLNDNVLTNSFKFIQYALIMAIESTDIIYQYNKTKDLLSEGESFDTCEKTLEATDLLDSIKTLPDHVDRFGEELVNLERPYFNILGPIVGSNSLRPWSLFPYLRAYTTAPLQHEDDVLVLVVDDFHPVLYAYLDRTLQLLEEKAVSNRNREKSGNEEQEIIEHHQLKRKSYPWRFVFQATAFGIDDSSFKPSYVIEKSEEPVVMVLHDFDFGWQSLLTNSTKSRARLDKYLTDKNRTSPLTQGQVAWLHITRYEATRVEGEACQQALNSAAYVPKTSARLAKSAKEYNGNSFDPVLRLAEWWADMLSAIWDANTRSSAEVNVNSGPVRVSLDLSNLENYSAASLLGKLQIAMLTTENPAYSPDKVPAAFASICVAATMHSKHGQFAYNDADGYSNSSQKRKIINDRLGFEFADSSCRLTRVQKMIFTLPENPEEVCELSNLPASKNAGIDYDADRRVLTLEVNDGKAPMLPKCFWKPLIDKILETSEDNSFESKLFQAQ